jgi:hypothetical protein
MSRTSTPTPTTTTTPQKKRPNIDVEDSSPHPKRKKDRDKNNDDYTRPEMGTGDDWKSFVLSPYEIYQWILHIILDHSPAISKYIIPMDDFQKSKF